MRRSALVRDKWERSDYLPRTITRACASKERVLCEQKPPAATGGITLTRIERTLANVGTQDAVALIFAEKMKGKMLYDRTRNTWLEYDGTRWRLDKLGKAHNLIRDIARELNRENKASMGAASFCDGVGRHLQSAPEFARTSDQFDQDNYLLNTAAGTFDLGTSEMRSHNPGDMLTLCTGVAPDHRGAETFHRFISEITMNDSYLMHFHQVALGACLSGAVEGHWMLFWTGGGRNGKNTLGDLVQDAMGDYARKVPSSTLMAKSFESHPTEIANLQGIRLATSSEINDGDHWDEARINEVTGDAILSDRFMRGDHFEFRRTHKHLIYGNNKPQLRSVSDGIRSRLKIFRSTLRSKDGRTLIFPRFCVSTSAMLWHGFWRGTANGWSIASNYLTVRLWRLKAPVTSRTSLPLNSGWPSALSALRAMIGLLYSFLKSRICTVTISSGKKRGEKEPCPRHGGRKQCEDARK